tara:strand:+ start:2577 stop:3062 length:486 start_codon:yes stop_codon:yes gene_type:complete
MSIPQDLLVQAGDIGAGMDQVEAQGMQVAMPQGMYSATALNALVDSVNEIMVMLGEQQPYPTFTEDQTSLPPDFVNMIMAIMSIAQDAQMPIEMALEEVVSDTEIARLVALLNRLANDAAFQEYLAGAAEPAMMEEETVVEETPEGEVAVSDEELFASRMR